MRHPEDPPPTTGVRDVLLVVSLVGFTVLAVLFVTLKC